jgi:hypothetical protein
MDRISRMKAQEDELHDLKFEISNPPTLSSRASCPFMFESPLKRHRRLL